MSELTVILLGTTEIEIDKRPLRKFRATKVQALLIYLLVQAEQVHQRESLMALLWPDDSLKSAQGSLRQTLHRLRQNIPDLNSANGDGPAPLIITDRQTIQLNPDVVYSLDVTTFKTLFNSTQTHSHDSLLSCPECEAKLKQIVSLYRGDFLTDFYLPDSAPFEEWAMGKREALRRQILDVLETLGEIAFHRNDYLDAQQIARQHLEIDNLDERAYRLLMKSLAHHGQRHEALAVYENCAQLLADELGMQPASQTTTLYEIIKKDDLFKPVTATEGVRGYDLQEQIGAGSFGMVHKALQKGIGREVAVKIIHPHYANQAEFIRRFEQEAQVVAMLEHPYIVPLYDYWREPDGAYLVMRLMRGGNLSDAIKKNRWTLPSTLPLIQQIATALNAAHQHGIIHRDVKPANILLDDEKNGYLSDFGIAKDLHQNEQLTQEQALLGSPSYISPEQILNEPVTDKTDQYSLGLVLYELLTGQPPYQENSLLDLMQKQVADPLPRLADQSLEIPSTVDAVIQRATAKRPSDRFPDILTFAQALQDACEPQSIEIRSVKPITVSPPIGEVENPYKGLRPFQEADAEMFYGRESLVNTLITELETSRFLAVLGPSGSGKSSVVKAGLLPALRRGALPDSENWFIAQMIPGTHPLEELESALMHLAVNPPPSLIEPLQKDKRGLVRVLKRILPQYLDTENPSQLLLFIDQFEELFTMVANDGDRQQFLDILLTAIAEPYGRLRVVITLRADFYDRPLQQPILGNYLREHTQIVLPLTATELEASITTPAAKMGVTFQPGLVAAIIADVNEQPGALPLLQYALTELFEHREGTVLTHTAYQEMGGILGALGKRAETIYANLSLTGKETAQQLFLRLVTLGEGSEDTRRRVRRAELQAVEKGEYQENLMESVIDEYGRHRLLTFDHDPITRGPTVEVAHEALLREWPRLRQWLDTSRDDVRQQRLLSISAAEWDESERDAGFLLRGSKLSAIDAWTESTALALTNLERNYINASLTARVEREQAEETRRQRELETAQKLAETERQRANEQEEATAVQSRAATKLRRRAYYLVGLLILVLLAMGATGLFAIEKRSTSPSVSDTRKYCRG